MDDVVIPQLEPIVDVDSFKDAETREKEAEEVSVEIRLKNEAEHPNFPLIRQHIELLIDQYGDVRSLAEFDGSSDEFRINAQVKALFVKEMKDLLDSIDQLTEVDMDNGSDG